MEGPQTTETVRRNGVLVISGDVAVVETNVVVDELEGVPAEEGLEAEVLELPEKVLTLVVDVEGEPLVEGKEVLTDDEEPVADVDGEDTVANELVEMLTLMLVGTAARRTTCAPACGRAGGRRGRLDGGDQAARDCCCWCCNGERGDGAGGNAGTRAATAGCIRR